MHVAKALGRVLAEKVAQNKFGLVAAVTRLFAVNANLNRIVEMLAQLLRAARLQRIPHVVNHLILRTGWRHCQHQAAKRGTTKCFYVKKTHIRRSNFNELFAKTVPTVAYLWNALDTDQTMLRNIAKTISKVGLVLLIL